MSPFEELRNGETLGFKKAQDIGLPRINKKLYGLDEIFVSRIGPNKIFGVYVLFWILILNQNKTTATNGSLLVLFILIKILFRDYASKVTRIFFDDTISNIFWYYN